MNKILSFDDLLLLQPYVWKKSSPLSCPKNSFFLSFTDSFVQLIKQFNVQKKEYLLLPNFYCPETVETMAKFMSVVFYKINDDFTVNKKSYFSQIKKYSPRIIINYNFTGFPLSNSEKKELQSLNPKTIIIEDCAHRIIQDNDIKPLITNHFYIDSIRKYSSFLGSHLVNFQISNKYRAQKISIYKVRVILFQLILQILWHFSIWVNSRAINDIALIIFKKQDSIVGTSKKSTFGDAFSYFFWKKLDFKKIKKHKKNLINIYHKNLYKVNIPYVKKLNFDSNFFNQDIYFPLLVDPMIREKLIVYLNKQNILTEELWEIPTYRKEEMNLELFKSVLVLPLSSQITENDVLFITSKIKKFMHHTEL